MVIGSFVWVIDTLPISNSAYIRGFRLLLGADRCDRLIEHWSPDRYEGIDLAWCLEGWVILLSVHQGNIIIERVALLPAGLKRKGVRTEYMLISVPSELPSGFLSGLQTQSEIAQLLEELYYDGLS